MIIKRILIDNFRSFQYPTEIKFPSVDENRSIFLVGGMNGSGKTSLIEAISICLYGTSKNLIYRQVNKNELAKGNSKVTFEVVLETDDNEELIIKRIYSSNAISEPKPKDFIEKLLITKNGSQVSIQNKDLWQDFINSTIPKSITQFFFFDGEKIQEVAADDHSEVRLKTSLEAALGINYISQLVTDILHVKQKERQSFIEVTDEEIEFKENNLKLLEKNKLKLKLSRDEVKEEINLLIKNHESLKKRFIITFDKVPGKNNQIESHEQKRIQESTKFNKIDYEARTIIEKYLPLSLASKIFSDLKKQIEKEAGARSVSALSKSSDLISQKALDALHTPTLLTSEEMTETNKLEFIKRFKDLLSKNIEGIDEFKKILDLSEREAAQVLLTIKDIEQSDIHRLEGLIDEKLLVKQAINKLNSEDTFQLSGLEEDLFKQLQEELDSLSTQIGRKKEELRNVDESLINVETSISSEEETISMLYERHQLSKEKDDFLKECDNLSKMLNEYVLILRKRKVELLTEKTFEMYKKLSSKSDLISNISIDQDSYEIQINDIRSKVIRKSGLSAGEKEIFAISLLWGLAQTSQIKLPIIIDTPLSRLDSTHRDNIIDNYFPSAGEQVIILSTDTEVDESYYKKLENHLAGAGQLKFDSKRELTVYNEGYFWK